MKPSLLFFLLFSCFHLCSCARSYDAIFSFGDSLSDAGNLIVKNPSLYLTAKWPYGMTFFHKPTGRCSDGRLFIDFLAEAFGLPLPPPSLKPGQNFHRGANFATTGGTVLDYSFFQRRGITKSIFTNGSLDTQISWFEHMKPSLCGTPQACKNYVGKSLFVVGEFGGNDYNAFLFSGRSMAEVRANAPKIVNGIVKGLERLIGNGAVDLVVPGILPIGCFPLYLQLYKSNNKNDYNRFGCLTKYNRVALYHNQVLKMKLRYLQQRYRGTRIMYGDFYNAAMHFVINPLRYGFTNGALKACCGGGGPYNVNLDRRCGQKGSNVCQNPSTYASWDGIHFTEAANRYIARGLLRGPYANPPIMS